MRLVSENPYVTGSKVRLVPNHDDLKYYSGIGTLLEYPVHARVRWSNGSKQIYYRTSLYYIDNLEILETGIMDLECLLDQLLIKKKYE